MCLIVRKGTPIQIATEDIICYKTLSENMTSLYHNFKYEIGKIYETKIGKLENPTIWTPENLEIQNFWFADKISHTNYEELKCDEIDVYQQGFHSYDSLERTNIRFSWELNVKCTIPKGSMYIVDETGLICSNQIIINGIV